MPVADVLRLQEYRDRRSSRLRLAGALQRGDPRKHEVFEHQRDRPSARPRRLAQVFGGDAPDGRFQVGVFLIDVDEELDEARMHVDQGLYVYFTGHLAESVRAVLKNFSMRATISGRVAATSRCSYGSVARS